MLHYQFTQIIYMYQYCFVWLRFLSDHLVDYINIRLSYIQLLVLLSKHENAKVHNNAENGSFSHSEEHEENKRKHVQKLLLRYANFYSTFFHVELSENRIANVEAYARTCPLI